MPRTCYNQKSHFLLVGSGTTVVCFGALWDNFFSLKRKKLSHSLYTNFLIVKGTIGINYLDIMPEFFIQYFLIIKGTIGRNYLDIVPSFLYNTL